jgi:hypothetical protein
MLVAGAFHPRGSLYERYQLDPRLSPTELTEIFRRRMADLPEGPERDEAHAVWQLLTQSPEARFREMIFTPPPVNISRLDADDGAVATTAASSADVARPKKRKRSMPGSAIASTTTKTDSLGADRSSVLQLQVATIWQELDAAAGVVDNTDGNVLDHPLAALVLKPPFSKEQK